METWSARDMIIETNRDVKWIRAALLEIREKENELDLRIRNLEEITNSFKNSTLRDSQISAGMGAGAGGFVAVIMKLLGG
ncbi:MAG: hypothetical protein JXQ82_00095 [Methanomicrobiaceae archaeon]|nr:hypothetical protein [Methanomicrobiaceae archaeon]